MNFALRLGQNFNSFWNDSKSAPAILRYVFMQISVFSIDDYKMEMCERR